MEQIHLCHRRQDSETEMSGDDHMQGMRTNTENGQTMKKDSPAGLSNAASPCLTKVRTSSRPRLQSTKSFPPLSECIGGIGEDANEEGDMISQCSIPRRDLISEKKLDNSSERGKSDFDFNTRCTKKNRRAKWGRWERRGASSDDESWRWECRNEMDEDSKQEKQNSSQDIKREAVERRLPDLALHQGTPKVDEHLEKTGSSSTHQCPVPHPMLSKLLLSTSSSSGGSTSSLSSAESDEVLSDKEDAVAKRTAFRKVRAREVDTDDSISV